MDVYTLKHGHAPLLISLPHDGSFIPPDIAARLCPAARHSPDTDWHVAHLYAPLAQELGASVLRPLASRYVVDLNRPADGHALYPGLLETGLVSTLGFDGEPLYEQGGNPDAKEIAQRVETYWRPYHVALRNELDRLLQLHGRVVLWDGHSIRSRVPMLFEGALPDLNLGTADGRSCRPALRNRLDGLLRSQAAYTQVVDGRFKGGYITRHYGRPEVGIDAVQLELAQVTYMDEATGCFDEKRAQMLREYIAVLLRCSLEA